MKLTVVNDETDEIFCIVDFPFREWRSLKKAAFYCGMTLQEFVLEAIERRIDAYVEMGLIERKAESAVERRRRLQAG